MRKPKVVPRNNKQYDHLVSEYIIQDKSGNLDRLSHLANNVYNMALYLLRQQLIKHHKWRDYTWLNKQFKLKYDNRENMLYSQFPYRQSVQQTLREVEAVWYAWVKAVKAYHENPANFTGRPRMPGYLKKGSRHVSYVTSQNAKVKDGYLIIQPRNGLLNIKIKLIDGIRKVSRVVFQPLSHQRFKVIVQYPITNTINYKPDNGRYMGIDPGLDNAFTCVINDNTIQPLIINGRGIKSVNQYYNKVLARLSSKHAEYKQCCVERNAKSGLQPIYYYSYHQQLITEWRNKKIRSFCHQASRRIINYALNNNVNTIVIGKNKGQKRSINMGKKNNQNFVGLPHAKMINMIKYKANLLGITVITTNESYTSQTSFLDDEKPCKQNGNYHRKLKHLMPIRRRIKRGLFRSNQGILINADVNGAFQIIRKVFPNVSFADGIAGAVLRPFKWSPTF